MAEENETECGWTLGFYREGGGERGGPMGRAKARGCVCEPRIVCACPPSLLTASFHSIRSVSLVWGVGCGVHRVWGGDTASQRKSYSCHCWNTYTQRQTLMALMFDCHFNSRSPHNKVQLCTSSELIWSSSPSRSQFFCRSKRDFNDVTEHWGDYVILHYK